MTQTFPQKLLETLQSQDFILLESHEEFKKAYPEKEYGQYHPQPISDPDSYPCLYRQETIYEASNGTDYVVLSFIYPPKEKYTVEDIDDYQNRLSDEDKDILIQHCNEHDISPKICAWYDDVEDFQSDWVDEVGYSEKDAFKIFSDGLLDGEFKQFIDGRIVRLVK